MYQLSFIEVRWATNDFRDGPRGAVGSATDFIVKGPGFDTPAF